MQIYNNIFRLISKRWSSRSKNVDIIWGALDIDCQIAPGKLYANLNFKQHSREFSDVLLLATTPEGYWKTKSWSNRPSRRWDRPTSQLTHHSLTWASMRARRSSSSFLFRMFSFSCLASDTAWRNWSKMPKNSSGCILPASSPKCFTALVNWKKGGFSKSGVPPSNLNPSGTQAQVEPNSACGIWMSLHLSLAATCVHQSFFK